MLLEYREALEPVDTHRESSGQDPMAGVGEVEGDGDSRRKEGCSRSSCVVAILADWVRVFPTNYSVWDISTMMFVDLELRMDRLFGRHRLGLQLLRAHSRNNAVCRSQVVAREVGDTIDLSECIEITSVVREELQGPHAETVISEAILAGINFLETINAFAVAPREDVLSVRGTLKERGKISFSWETKCRYFSFRMLY